MYKGNAYSLFYSKTNDEVPVVDIKGCQLENTVEASWVKAEVGRLNPVVVEKLGLNKWNSIQESDNPVLAFYRFK